MGECEYCGSPEKNHSAQPTPGFYGYETIYECGNIIHTWFVENEKGDLTGETEHIDKQKCKHYLQQIKREEKLKKLLE